MSEDTSHKSYEWAEALFRGDYDVAHKYRDMLALVAARMMGNASAAKHFYDQAIVDGASDAELNRVLELSRSTGIEIGDLASNIQKRIEEMNTDQEKPADRGNADSQPGVN